MRIKSWKERALEELNELHARILKLQAFCKKENKNVSDLHWQQLVYMQMYERVLFARREQEKWDA